MFSTITQSQAMEWCSWDVTHLLFFSRNVPDSSIYYAHFFPAMLALVFGMLVWWSNRTSPIGRAMFFVSGAFFVWSLADMVVWSSERLDHITAWWSLLTYLDLLMYAAMVYVAHLFVRKRSLSPRATIAIVALFLPVIIFGPSSANISAIDMRDCGRDVIEGWVVYYNYIAELALIAYILLICVSGIIKSSTQRFRGQIFLLTVGVLGFLGTFYVTNVIGSLTEDWAITKYGLYGMPLFVAMLSYSILRYQSHHKARTVLIRMLIATQWALIASLLFVRDPGLIGAVTVMTLLFSVVLNLFINSILSKETFQRQEIENLLQLITHQVKGFLTKSRSIFSVMLDGDFGPVSPQLQGPLREGLASDAKGVELVESLLQVANFRDSAVAYSMHRLDFVDVVDEIVQEMRPAVEAKGLKFDVTLPKLGTCFVMADNFYLRQAIKNIIDNSIRYTPVGSIDVRLEVERDTSTLVIHDTGVGIDDDDMERLFTEGGRGKDSRKVNVESTGYGLFIVKYIMDGHLGRVWAESAGPGKGATFSLQFPKA